MAIDRGDMTVDSLSKKMTLGAERVRYTFNPTGDSMVEHIKKQLALLIDLCEELKVSGSDARLCSIAQTSLEEAAMWTVKAATSSK